MNKAMRFLSAISALLLVVLISGRAVEVAAQVPPKPAVAGAVHDLAGIIPQQDRVQMNARLLKLAEETSNRIVVVTVGELGGMSPAEFAYELGESWGVGDARFDNGIVVLVKPKTAGGRGDVFIAVGYGLEGVIPDAVAKRIVEEQMIPHFRENDYAGGVTAALDVLIPLAAGEISYRELPRTQDESSGLSVLFWLGGMVLLALLFNSRPNGGSGTYSGRGRSAGPFIWLGGFGGGFGGGSGGSFGGGGFSGGFGGGSFGGGGAGGSW